LRDENPLIIGLGCVVAVSCLVGGPLLVGYIAYGLIGLPLWASVLLALFFGELGGIAIGWVLLMSVGILAVLLDQWTGKDTTKAPRNDGGGD
jgi:hypothetical protein